MAHEFWRAAEKDLRVARRDAPRQHEYAHEVRQILGELMVLAAMKFGRAPLPIPWALVNGYMYRGWPENMGELDTFVTRYLFLGDARLALSGVQIRVPMSPPAGPAFKFGPDAGKQLDSLFEACAQEPGDA